MFKYRPLASPANWAGFEIAKSSPSWHAPDLELGAFLVLHSSHQLHETIDLPAQSLIESWRENDRFHQRNERTALPPLVCLPIYLITVGQGLEERLVYIGQTSSSSSRFVAGHKAMTLLHAPCYQNQAKRLYRCGVVLLSARLREVPIEWVTPYELGRRLLTAIENTLIYHFQPELNVRLKRKLPGMEIGTIHIQNIIEESEFLGETFVS